jgi:hypothetical protein
MSGKMSGCTGCFWLAYGDRWCSHAVHYGVMSTDSGQRCKGEGYRYVPEHERSVALWEAFKSTVPRLYPIGPK